MNEKTTRYCRRCGKPVDVNNFSHRRIKTCIPCQAARTKRQPDLVRVVTTSRDASRDYWLPREEAVELCLEMVSVYPDELSYFDPGRRWVSLAWRRGV